MAMLQDLTNKVFGSLRVESRAENSKNGTARWNCICECGGKTVAFGTNLTRNHSTSCGCYALSTRKTHGKSHTRLYRIHHDAQQRCYNPNATQYEDYGGRGITVCDEWMGRSGFLAFYEWAISNGYSDTLTLDRKDNDKGYLPNNCHWVTRQRQQRNTRPQKRNKSGVKGVNWNHLSQNWRARVRLNGKTINLGSYDTVEAAAAARRRWELDNWPHLKEG